MNIPELKMDLEVIKLMIKQYEERGGGYSQKVALQNTLSACQLLCDVSDKMLPKKYTDEELQNILTELGATELHLAEHKNNIIDEMVLWLTKKMMGIEEIIERYDFYAENALDKTDKKSSKLANAIRQEMEVGE